MDFLFDNDLGRIVFAALSAAAVTAACYGVIYFMKWLKRITGNNWLDRDD